MITVSSERMHMVGAQPVLGVVRPRKRNIESVLQLQVGLPQHECSKSQVYLKAIQTYCMGGRNRASTECSRRYIIIRYRSEYAWIRTVGLRRSRVPLQMRKCKIRHSVLLKSKPKCQHEGNGQPKKKKVANLPLRID